MRALVTGGGGFLGGAIVRRLIEAGHEVVSISRGSYPELEELGVTSRSVDLGQGSDVLAAFRELGPFDVVFHTAALTGIWGRREDYFRTNLDGTRHILAATIECGIPKLVYTSSPSVCFDGKNHVDAKNDLPYPRSFLAHYPASKAQAESLVLCANARAGLNTVALRPHLIFGPGDPHLLPRVVERAAAGRLAIIGKGKNVVSLTYIDNAAAAHMDAADALGPDEICGGKAYFIGQAESVQLWPWINGVLKELGVPQVKKRVPKRVAIMIGSVCELIWKLTRRSGEPPMTRFVALQLATSHSYDMSIAQEELGYRERVDLAEATRRAVEDLRSPH